MESSRIKALSEGYGYIAADFVRPFSSSAGTLEVKVCGSLRV